MKTYRILVVAAVLLMVPALASAASLTPQAPATGVSQAAPAVPTLDAFLSSLKNPGTPPGAKAAASGCGPDFCTSAERTACNQQCFAHHHGPFVGLECCSDTCTTLCICGSVPTSC